MICLATKNVKKCLAQNLSTKWETTHHIICTNTTIAIAKIVARYNSEMMSNTNPWPQSLCYPLTIFCFFTYGMSMQFDHLFPHSHSYIFTGICVFTLSPIYLYIQTCKKIPKAKSIFKQMSPKGYHSLASYILKKGKF